MNPKQTPIAHLWLALILSLTPVWVAIGCNCGKNVYALDGFYEGDVVTYKDNENARFTVIALDESSRQAKLAYTGRDGMRGEVWREISTLQKIGENGHETIDLVTRVMLGEKELPCTRVQGVYYVDPHQVQFIPHPHTVVAEVSKERDNSWKEGDLVQYRVDAARTMIISRLPNDYNPSVQCSWQLPDGSVQRQEFLKFELERVNSFEDDADLLAYNLQD